MITAALLESIDILNRWARGNGREYATEVYHLKAQAIRQCKGWSFRTSVIVPCNACSGTGLWRNIDYCWHCNGGNATLQFLLSEIPCGGKILQWHTPRARATWLTSEEFERLQMVPPGTWKPNQPGEDLDRAAMLALLVSVQHALRPAASPQGGI